MSNSVKAVGFGLGRSVRERIKTFTRTRLDRRYCSAKCRWAHWDAQHPRSHRSAERHVDASALRPSDPRTDHLRPSASGWDRVGVPKNLSARTQGEALRRLLGRFPRPYRSDPSLGLRSRFANGIALGSQRMILRFDASVDLRHQPKTLNPSSIKKPCNGRRREPQAERPHETSIVMTRPDAGTRLRRLAGDGNE